MTLSSTVMCGNGGLVRDASGGDEVVLTVEVAGRFLVNPSVDEVEALLADAA